MKKLLVLFILFPSLCFAASAVKNYNGVLDSSVKLIQGKTSADVKTANGVDYNDGDSVATCNTTAFDETTGTDDNTVGPEGGYIGHGLYTPAANRNICRIDFNFQSNPNGTVTAGVYTENSGTEAITGTVCEKSQTVNATGWVQFDFTGDCNITTSGVYAFAVKKDGTAITLYDSGTTTLDSGQLATWNSNLSKANSWATFDGSIKLYDK
jgi:hypothetical protein